MGRISTFSQLVADAICERLESGEPLMQICRDEEMPKVRTVYDWRDANEEFAARFARAREVGFDAIAQDALNIANTPIIGEEIEESENGTKVKRGDMLGHRKLQIETRLKLLAKWDPRRYGERVQTELTGADGGPIQVDDASAAGRAAALLALAQKRKDETNGGA